MEKCVFGLEMFSMGLQISKSTFEVVKKQKYYQKLTKSTFKHQHSNSCKINHFKMTR